MAGNGDETGRDRTGGAEPEGAGWAAAVMAVMRTVMDRAVEVVKDVEIETGDVGKAERVARTVGVISRSVRSIQLAQTRARGRSSEHQTAEEAMRQAIEYDPEQVAAMRDELWKRALELEAIIERKTGARNAERRGHSEAAEGPAGIGRASGADAVELADLGAAGRSGSGKDICRRALAS